ncbi:hypothetical protein [Streptomyces sp. LN704]|uniref:hypothetical protein n=1 Tax=unclassified Streptomyces TaxID=2593676 RepID=UPI003720514E
MRSRPRCRALFLHSEGELTKLRVPLLDWLPAPLQARGEAFLRDAQAQRAATPGPLLPHLIVEDHPADPVRFALRANSRHLAEHELASTAQRLFGPFRMLAPADSPAPRSSDTTSREPITTGIRT